MLAIGGVSILIGLAAAICLAYIALDHNPQGEFRNLDSGSLVIENLLPLVGIGFAIVAALSFVGGLVLRWLIRLARRPG